MILCLETSTNLCSVALCNNNGVVASMESGENKSHASLLTVFITDILKDAGIKADDLEAVAVSKGPGSYTGLRIGVSTAKGIAYAASIPLIGIETTLSMFHGITDSMKKKYDTDDSSFFIPMIDARRMEVYYTIFRSDGKTIKETSAEMITQNSFRWIPESTTILIFGNGAAKCKGILNIKNIKIADEFKTSAAFMYKPAYKALIENKLEDIAYFEPFYLKDFLSSRPNKNILGR